MQTFWVGGHGRDVGGDVQGKVEPARVCSGPQDLHLAFELSPQVDCGDVQRDGAGFHAGKVEQLLRHAKHALRLLMHDIRRPRPFGGCPQAAVNQCLAETDQARERRLQLMRDVGEELALDRPRSFHGLSHAIERRAQHPDLVSTANPDPARVVAGGDVLRGAGQLSERLGERAAHEQHQEHRRNQCRATCLEQQRRQLAGRGCRHRRTGPRHQDVGGSQRVSRRGECNCGRDIALPSQIGSRLKDAGHALGRLDRDDLTDGG